MRSAWAGLWFVACSPVSAPDDPPAPRTAREERAASPNPAWDLGPGIAARDLPGGGLPLSVRARDLDVPRGFAPPLSPGLPDEWASITGAWHDESLGERLEARLAEFSAGQVLQNGTALLTLEEMWGTEEEDYEDGLCEPLDVVWELEEGGEDYEATARLWQFSALHGGVSEYTVSLGSACAAALETQLPADALACSESEELTLFREGTACRACLDAGDGWTACADQGECFGSGPLVWMWNGLDGAQIPIETYYARAAACAPDWYTLFLMVAVADDDRALPAAWESDRWIGYCYPYWLEEIDDVYYGCNGELLDGTEQNVLGEGIFTRLMGVRADGGSVRGAHWDRAGFARRIELDNGALLEHTWMGPGLGHLPAPVEQGGWGLPATQTRPGGDPDDPDDTFARDLIAAWTLKSTTRRNGVQVTFANHNRCAEGDWQGPDARGRYLCEDLALPTPGFSDDAQTWWVADEATGLVTSIPMMTLASTGLPDPDVPGGVAIEVRSSPGYEALERWSFPKTFEPDLVRFDVVPEADASGPGGPLIGQTYRFGKDPAFDARMVMGTNWHRFHRPTGDE